MNKNLNSKPLISVVMSVYNENPDTLQAAIDSILLQTYDNTEFIIVLDNPGNADALHVLEKYKQADERIELLLNECNRGLVYSLNKAIDVSNGAYICRMDADDVSFPERIEKQLDYLMQNDLDLIGSTLVVIDELGDELYSTSNIPSAPAKVNKALKWNDCVPHPTWFGTRKIFLQKYREILPWEDYDFLIRSVLNGYKIGNINQCLFSYRISENGISQNNLYHAYLGQKYLTKAYRGNKTVDPEQIKAWVHEREDPKRSSNYSKANRLFNEGMNCLHRCSYLQAMKKILRIPFVSLAYVDKIRRLGMAAAIAYSETSRT